MQINTETNFDVPVCLCKIKQNAGITGNHEHLLCINNQQHALTDAQMLSRVGTFSLEIPPKFQFPVEDIEVQLDGQNFKKSILKVEIDDRHIGPCNYFTFFLKYKMN